MSNLAYPGPGTSSCHSTWRPVVAWHGGLSAAGIWHLRGEGSSSSDTTWRAPLLGVFGGGSSHILARTLCSPSLHHWHLISPTNRTQHTWPWHDLATHRPLGHTKRCGGAIGFSSYPGRHERWQTYPCHLWHFLNDTISTQTRNTRHITLKCKKNTH